jgi:hypothetical protein
MKLPIWLIGKNVTSVVARIATVDAAGTITDSTPNLTITGVVDEVDYAGRQSSESVVNLTSIRENLVPTEVDDQFVLTEILQAGTGTRNFLSQLWHNATPSPYVKLTLTRGNNTWTFYGVMSEYVESYRKAKSTGRMTLMQIDLMNTGVNDAANPAYA